MAMRSAIARVFRCSSSSSPAPAPAVRRWLSDGRGKVLNEEEKAKENVYIQKMEREKMERLKKKAEKEKEEAEKSAGKSSSAETK
ncbi:hypothetical protein Taro_029145 [Colocasia esculenta]|uniref:Uncharacterized protein n=1 Tax=Colocasia esculenta TaxID=4460 RepID=A0A843VN53_COLES|nr:hypothetical protein [Colocasia esculenta]